MLPTDSSNWTSLLPFIVVSHNSGPFLHKGNAVAAIPILPIPNATL